MKLCVVVSLNIIFAKLHISEDLFQMNPNFAHIILIYKGCFRIGGLKGGSFFAFIE